MKRSRFLFFLSVAAVVALTACKKSEPTGETRREPSATAPSSTPETGSGVELKVKWPVGTKFTYRMDLAHKTSVPMPGLPQPMLNELSIAQTYALSVLKEIPGGGRQLELEYVAQELDFKMGGQVVTSFDSKSASESDQNHPLRKLTGAKIRINLDAKGEVESFEGLDELRAKLGTSAIPQLQVITQQMVSEDSVRQFVFSNQGLPNKRVVVGESWPFEMEVAAEPLGDITIKTTIKFTGIEKRENRQCAALQSSGTMSASGGSFALIGKVSMDKGTISGTNWFDPELGAMVESASDHDLKMKIEIRGFGGASGANALTTETTQKLTLKLVDVAKLAP